MTKRSRDRISRYYSREYDKGDGKYKKLEDGKTTVYGGEAAFTLAYQPRDWDSPSPQIRFLPLRSPGRRIELGTARQYRLWQVLSRRLDDLEPGKFIRTTLAELSDLCELSRSQISRFLAKLDWWRFIDLRAVPGHGGGVYIWQPPTVRQENESWGKQYIPPHLKLQSRRMILRHRIWQWRFEQWQARVMELREELRHLWHIMLPPPPPPSPVRPITTLTKSNTVAATIW